MFPKQSKTKKTKQKKHMNSLPVGNLLPQGRQGRNACTAGIWLDGSNTTGGVVI